MNLHRVGSISGQTRPLDRVFISELSCALFAAEAILPSSDQFDYGYSPRDEYVTDWVLDHLIQFITWTLCGRISLTILKWSFEAAKHMAE